MEKAYFAGGCFWCTEAVFQRIKGVDNVRSGFSGGNIKNPAYREVVTERTGHAETIEITFNPSEVSYLKLLEVFFGTHDPTTLNRQGADKGTHYRSAIFFTTKEQQLTATSIIEQLDSASIFEHKIVTEVSPFDVFYPAEDYHTNYYNLNTEQGYCQFVITPKIKKLEAYFNDILK